MRVFLTGDRQMSPIYPMQVVLEVVRALAAGNTIVTGINGGVEELVRSLADQITEFNVEVVEQDTLDTGKPDFMARAAKVAAMDDIAEIVVIHADPHLSNVAKSFLAEAEGKTRLVTPADLLA